MCQKKPGPRCAGHLREAMDSVRILLAENHQAMSDGQPVPHPTAAARQMRLQDEYDETPTGQHELAAAIHRSDDPDTKTSLRQRKEHARRRYEVKKAAAAAEHSGDARASAIIQRTAHPDTGWLAHSRLNALNDASFARMRISDDGQGMHAAYPPEPTTDYSTDPAREVLAAPVIYEAQAAPGPDGTYLVHPGSDREVLYRPSTIDDPHEHLIAYDSETAETGQSMSLHDMAPWPAHAPALDTHDQPVDYAWEGQPDIVRDPLGTPVLIRWYGTAQQSLTPTTGTQEDHDSAWGRLVDRLG